MVGKRAQHSEKGENFSCSRSVIDRYVNTFIVISFEATLTCDFFTLRSQCVEWKYTYFNAGRKVALESNLYNFICSDLSLYDCAIDWHI